VVQLVVWLVVRPVVRLVAGRWSLVVLVAGRVAEEEPTTSLLLLLCLLLLLPWLLLWLPPALLALLAPAPPGTRTRAGR
jgi:hypothetical protein